jgi:hypothetical protein
MWDLAMQIFIVSSFRQHRYRCGKRSAARRIDEVRTPGSEMVDEPLLSRMQPL